MVELASLLCVQEGGAAQLLRAAINWLIEHPAALSGVHRDATLETLRHSRPTMAGFAVLANRIEGALSKSTGANLEDVLQTLQMDFETAEVRMAENFALLIQAKAPVKVVTLSFSSSVLRALEVARTSVAQLLVLESCPGGEGRELARSASRFLHSVQLLPDRDLPLAVRASDLGIIGADTVFPDGSVLNKVLSVGLAELLNREQKPLYVLTTSWKFLPHQGATSSPSRGYQLTKSDHERFEHVSSGQITAIITEQRIGVPPRP